MHNQTVSQTRNLTNAWLAAFAPPPNISVSEWSEENRILSGEDSAEPGTWSNDRFPAQKGMMDEVGKAKIVYVMAGAQVGKTVCCILNPIGRAIDLDPGPMLLLLPTEELGKSFSIQRLDPLWRDTKSLQEKVAKAGTKSRGNSLMSKRFAGGSLTLVGSNKPGNLASRPIRYLFADEVDKYPPSAGKEGDPLALAIKRTQTFHNGRAVAVSSPTVDGASRIQQGYETGDQRKWFVPCPDCDEHSPADFQNVIYDDPADAAYSCPHCGCLMDNPTWKRACRRGEWRATATGQPGVVSFHISALISPWSTLEELAQKEAAAKGMPQLMKVFVNTELGLPYDPSVEEGIQADDVRQHQEQYGPFELDEMAAIVTAGVDVQADRLECTTTAWGVDHEPWVMSHRIFWGDPTAGAVWADLEEYLLDSDFNHPSGNVLQIESAAIDSGYLAQTVYNWTGRQQTRGRRFIAIKGVPGAGKVAIKAGMKTKTGHRIHLAGVDGVKDTLFNKITAEQKSIHFPGELPETYFDQLTAEVPKTKTDAKGFPVRVWEKVNRRNEAFDCLVYSYVALAHLGNIDLARRLRNLNQPPEPKPTMAELAARLNG